VVALTHKHRECQVVLDSGQHVPTDFVVAGIGVTPTVELFHRTALDASDGITVNAFLETRKTAAASAAWVALPTASAAPPTRSSGSSRSDSRAVGNNLPPTGRVSSEISGVS